MQLEATAGEVLEGRAVAPVLGQEPARLAGRRTGDRTALNDDDVGALRGEVVGDGCADHAPAQDQNPHTYPILVREPASQPRPKR